MFIHRGLYTCKIIFVFHTEIAWYELRGLQTFFFPQRWKSFRNPCWRTAWKTKSTGRGCETPNQWMCAECAPTVHDFLPSATQWPTTSLLCAVCTLLQEPQIVKPNSVQAHGIEWDDMEVLPQSTHLELTLISQPWHALSRMFGTCAVAT